MPEDEITLRLHVTCARKELAAQLRNLAEEIEDGDVQYTFTFLECQISNEDE